MKRFVAKAVKAAGPRSSRKRLMRLYRGWSQKRRAQARQLAFADWTAWINRRAAARAARKDR
jgi:hypothetical protein